MIMVLKLLKEGALGHGAPKVWAQDLSLRIVDRFYQRLIGGKGLKQVPETQYWLDMPIRDLTYTGIGALREEPPEHRDSGNTPLSHSFPVFQTTLGSPGEEKEPMSTQEAPEGLSAVAIEQSIAAVQRSTSGAGHLRTQQWTSTLSKPVLTGSDLLADEVSSIRATQQPPSSGWVEEGTPSTGQDVVRVHLAYQKVYKLHQDARKVVLGSLQACEAVSAAESLERCTCIDLRLFPGSSGHAMSTNKSYYMRSLCIIISHPSRYVCGQDCVLWSYIPVSCSK
jgi:hypothetical protein